MMSASSPLIKESKMKINLPDSELDISPEAEEEFDPRPIIIVDGGTAEAEL